MADEAAYDTENCLLVLMCSLDWVGRKRGLFSGDSSCLYLLYLRGPPLYVRAHWGTVGTEVGQRGQGGGRMLGQCGEIWTVSPSLPLSRVRHLLGFALLVCFPDSEEAVMCRQD